MTSASNKEEVFSQWGIPSCRHDKANAKDNQFLREPSFHEQLGHVPGPEFAKTKGKRKKEKKREKAARV